MSKDNFPDTEPQQFKQDRVSHRFADLKFQLLILADKWDSADYAIEQINNPLLPQEQCAIELRELYSKFQNGER